MWCDVFSSKVSDEFEWFNRKLKISLCIISIDISIRFFLLLKLISSHLKFNQSEKWMYVCVFVGDFDMIFRKWFIQILNEWQCYLIYMSSYKMVWFLIKSMPKSICSICHQWIQELATDLWTSITIMWQNIK